MAAGEEALSFDAIIQADRQRRKNEALAKEIFGKGRRPTTPANAGNRSNATAPSLASRVGVAKASQRSASSTPKPKANIDATWGHDLHHVNNPQASRLSRLPRDNAKARITRDDRLLAAVQTDSALNGASDQATVRAPGNGYSIRGLAGPYVVHGSNFAPGTTAADIESAMEPIGGEIQRCKIVTSTPTVIAEMVFTDKAGAENVIATFNNQKADGRILHVHMKHAASAPAPPAAPVRAVPTGPRATRPDLIRAESAYNSQREQSDRDRRRAEPEFQDGSYGLGGRDDDMDVEMDDRRDVVRDTGRDVMRDTGRNERRDVGWNRDGGRGRDAGRGAIGLYSDDLYRPRGRGIR
ncbi:MAG: hypothetical protein FRX48_03901 [Lasallia pustulata]|uniref:Uncharacterized protein n=1 Tax=Lasallia pustulata TaxID=136370 RepID=A0A5M8PTI5_9LECA|nr:MAG: hypothetical protein FRX48_03901 [Lasallia pustulata]